MRPYAKGQKNDFNDAEAIAEAVQRPTMKFVATKTADQLDLQTLHRVRERLVSQRTGIINQIRAFMLERGIAVRQGIRFLRAELPIILASRADVLSPRMLRVIEDLAGDWRRLDERIDALSREIETIARQDAGCDRLMGVPGIGPITSSAVVAAVGSGHVFSNEADDDPRPQVVILRSRFAVVRFLFHCLCNCRPGGGLGLPRRRRPLRRSLGAALNGATTLVVAAARSASLSAPLGALRSCRTSDIKSPRSK